MKQKLMSRKLWSGIVGVVSGIALIVSGNVVAGTATIITSILGYMVIEGMVDAKSVQTIIQVVDEVEKQLKEKEEK